MTDEMMNERSLKPAVTHKWKGKNQILTLTSSEAVNVGLASGIAGDLDELYQGLGVMPATIDRADVTASETTARFLSNPIWSVLLVIIGLVGLIWEMKSPGHGVGYIVFAFCLGFFFWLQVFAANAGLFEILLFGAGAALVAIEVFVLPTFGVGLVIGFGMVLLSIILAFVPENLSLWNLMRGRGSDQEIQRLGDSLKWAALTVIAIVSAAITGLIKGVKLPGLSRLALQTENAAAVHDIGVSELALSDSGRKLIALIGQNATTETVLRPAGKIRLEGVTYDAVSEGAFIEPGSKVVVLRVAAGNLVVRAV
jgi:membrane-bound serine protease (ClpP class)